MDIKELEFFLSKVNIPEIKVRPKTFLGIAKQPHYENVISNIYSFYFVDNNAHKLKDLFITTLVQLINKKVSDENTYQISGKITAETEYSTIKGGRIDLLLKYEDQAISTLTNLSS